MIEFDGLAGRTVLNECRESFPRSDGGFLLKTIQDSRSMVAHDINELIRRHNRDFARLIGGQLYRVDNATKQTKLDLFIIAPDSPILTFDLKFGFPITRPESISAYTSREYYSLMWSIFKEMRSKRGHSFENDIDSIQTIMTFSRILNNDKTSVHYCHCKSDSRCPTCQNLAYSFVNFFKDMDNI